MEDEAHENWVMSEYRAKNRTRYAAKILIADTVMEKVRFSEHLSKQRRLRRSVGRKQLIQFFNAEGMSIGPTHVRCYRSTARKLHQR